MNRRKTLIVVGCMVIAGMLMPSAEAGGRKRPGVAPPAPQPAGTKATLVNKTNKNLYTVVYATPSSPDGWPTTVAKGNALGGKVVNAGGTAVFTNFATGPEVRNVVSCFNVAVLQPFTPATSLVGGWGGGDAMEDNFFGVKNKNTILEISEEAGTGFLILTVK